MIPSTTKNNKLKDNNIKKINIILIRSIIKYTIIIGWISLALITSIIIIYEYGSDHNSKKEIYWHIVITIFIIVIASSFFLQTLLKNTKTRCN